AVRLRAGDLGVDLRQVRGTGPANRITHADLDLFVTGGVAATRQSSAASALGAVTETKIVGLRRKIAEQMSRSASRIPHISYVDEVDLAGVESLRAALNDGTRTKLTLLPFVIRALVRAIAEQPHLNSTFDDESGVLSTFADVNVGIATQTSNGLIVPVVRNAGRRSVWATAAEIARVSEAARTGTATRDDLNGSTITITSLGALGGLVTTPIINHPEVAIIGINKIQIRPVWDTDHFVPKPMMNLSSSFDHRIVDGFDAATFIQRIKALLETPALLFIGGDGDELIDGDGERNSKDSG
ncbi:MAG: dihydrolipoamide acetyltransferase family protein, partial [Ilumatobacteraceae bacterium]